MGPSESKEAPRRFLGTTLLTTGSTSDAAGGAGPETHVALEFDAHFERLAKGAASPSRVPASHVPRPLDSVLLGYQAGAGFNGLTHYDQRFASNGNQFSSEPPDQALAVGNGHLIEAVNNAIRVRTTTGTKLSTLSLNKFFNLAPSIDRKTGQYGPSPLTRKRTSTFRRNVGS